MISLCKEYYQFLLAQGFLLGTVMSITTWPAVGLVGKYFKQKRAAAMGIVLAGSSAGGVVWPIAIDQLLKRPNIGFAWTMRIVGFIMIPLLLFSCLVCRAPPTAVASEDIASERNTTSSANSSTDADEKLIDRKAEVIAFYKQPSLQLLCLAMFFTYFGMFSPFFYTTSYAVQKGFSSSLAFYTVSIVNAASFPAVLSRVSLLIDLGNSTALLLQACQRVLLHYAGQRLLQSQAWSSGVLRMALHRE